MRVIYWEMIDMKKVLILIGKSFEDRELIYPYYRFQEDGYGVEVVGSSAKTTYIGLHGMPWETDVGPNDVKVDDYEAFVIVGGHAPDKMRQDPALVKIVKDAFDTGKVVGAICHGPQLLIEADVLRGRKATCYKAIVTDVKNAGAVFEDKQVVVDGNLVTSQHPRDLPVFVKSMLELLE